MWQYNSKCTPPEKLNGGNMLTHLDSVTAEIFNVIVHNLLYIYTNMEVQ